MLFKTKGTEIVADKELASLRKLKNKEYKFKLAVLKSHKKIVFKLQL